MFTSAWRSITMAIQGPTMTKTTSNPPRIGPLFREKPFYIAVLWARLTEPARELALEELVREDALARYAFGIKEIGA